MTISLPGLSTLMNLYSAYSFGGLKHTSVLATTTLVDGVLSSYYGVSRNYVSLSSFWGYIAYNAVKEISPLIAPSYKIPLSFLSFLVSTAMVWQGTDIFAKKIDLKKALDSIKLTASFFDEKGIIETIGQKFSEGYGSGIKYTAQNFTSLISNKFTNQKKLH